MSVSIENPQVQQALHSGDLIAAINWLRTHADQSLLDAISSKIAELTLRIEQVTQVEKIEALQAEWTKKNADLEDAIRTARKENLAERDDIAKLRKEALAELDALKRRQTEDQTKRLQEIAAEEDRVNAAREEAADRLAKIKTREEELEKASADIKAREKAVEDKAKRLADAPKG